MTEYDLFVRCIPMIAEIVARSAEMNDAEYLHWKTETLTVAPEVVKCFMSKVLIVIDKYRLKERVGKYLNK